ncbi:PREDICTED: chymotrypsin-2-like [Polistes dominula]|uniref:Chymotrypsin-2-like n=1 Tax=Polistes dominula TaxID=743375 RepID=A0ABM1I7Q2_POLDO|nr:PREDICTED: chymotrypsin-2-like [Polistes dominula]
MARKNIIKAIIACLFASIVSTVYCEPPEALVGASLARDNEFPYLVSIRIDNNLHCGGCIIGPYHILTAAHCVVPLLDAEPGEVTIVAGTNNLYSGGQVYEPSLYIRHHDFNPKNPWINDIGIIKLASPIEFNDRVKPIALPTQKPPVHTNAIIGAWGATSSYPRRASPLLRKLNLKTLSQDECQSYFSSIDIKSSQICTLVQKNVGTCSGDSGSPLSLFNEVIGIVSGGIPCARGIPDVFTSVYSYLSFIKYAITL